MALSLNWEVPVRWERWTLQAKSGRVVNVENNQVIIESTVLAINCLGADVHEVIFQLPQDAQVEYQPGQHLLLASLAGEFSPFSIASAPEEAAGGRLRVQILAVQAEPMRLLAELQRDKKARIQLPFGDVCVDVNDPAPLLLIAAGTGMAQVHSILEQARHQGSTTKIHLYWGAREMAAFYWVAAWAGWEAMPNVQLHKVVSHDDEAGEGNALLYEAVIRDMPDLSGYRVIASGSPAMVYGTLDALVEHGMQPEQMQADAFSYAPRPEPVEAN